MIIQRIWSMPNRNTFKIKPIKYLIQKYSNGIIIDPFANRCQLGTITNDLNPEFKTHYNLDALSFLKKMKTESADVVYFDPPYSLRQAAECYKSFGKEKLKDNVVNMRYWSNCKKEAARICNGGGIVMCFGWNSNGVGIKNKMEMIEILIVAHGGSKNDTIVTVERKRINNQTTLC